jgi:hypothetical protein
MLDLGLGSTNKPFPKLNANERTPTQASTLASAKTSPVFDLVDQSTLIYDGSGGRVITDGRAAPLIDVGGGATMSFDPDTLSGRITPTLAGKVNQQFDKLLGGGEQVFSGSDIRLMIEIADPISSNQRWAKQLIECTTLTVSVHRVKDPARACGYIGAKGYSRGGRTIAGTLVLTEFSKDVLFEFLAAFALRDKSKDTHYAKVDQLPPFNLSVLFSNEFGYVSYRRILGMDFVTDGTVYSINDAFSERTISYVAADYTSLMPLALSSIYAKPSTTDPTTARERTPGDCMGLPKDTKASEQYTASDGAISV